jgi:hypothetical protein
VIKDLDPKTNSRVIRALTCENCGAGDGNRTRAVSLGKTISVLFRRWHIGSLLAKLQVSGVITCHIVQDPVNASQLIH